jgi:hypothetical protein
MRKYANDKDICGSKRQWCLTRDDWARARDVQRWGMELTEMELAAMEMSCSRRNRSRSGKDVEGQGTGGRAQTGLEICRATGPSAKLFLLAAIPHSASAPSFSRRV